MWHYEVSDNQRYFQRDRVVVQARIGPYLYISVQECWTAKTDAEKGN